jgi:RNA polymerase primary sigma factor
MRTPPQALECYLKEIVAAPVLPHEELLALARRARRGCRESRQTIIRSNLRLVVSIALRFRGRGAELSEIVAEGNLGLIRAVERFDPSRGYRFSTYATWWIQQAIRIALRERSSLLRLPSHMIDGVVAWNRAARRLADRLDREPLHVELASELGMGRKRAAHVAHAVRLARRPPLSLSVPQSGSHADTFEDVIEDRTALDPTEHLARHEDLSRLRAAIDGLEGRLAAILRARFGLDGGAALTLRAVGERLGLTRERVRQLERRALDQLRIALAGHDPRRSATRSGDERVRRAERA